MLYETHLMRGAILRAPTIVEIFFMAFSEIFQISLFGSSKANDNNWIISKKMKMQEEARFISFLSLRMK
jgi:hypothetical protein